MALDPVLAAGVKPVQFENPMNSLAQMMQIKQVQSQFDQQQRAMDDQNKLRDYFAKNDQNSPEFVRGLYGVNPTQAMAFEKTRLESRKDQTEIDAKSFDLASKREQGYKSTLAALFDRPDLSKPLAVAAMQAKLNEGLITPQMFQHVTGDLPDDPVALREQLRQGLKEQLSPEQKLTLFAPKFEYKDNGQQLVPVQTNSLATGYTAPTAIQRMQTPDSVASNATTLRGQNLLDARGKEANRLKEREIEVMGQQSSGGALLGAPVPSVLPWANQSNPKDANKVKANEQTRGSKEIEKDIDAARKESEAAAAAKRFIELNKGTTTGGLVDRIGVTRGLQSLGSNYSEMEAITAKLAPSMRAEGSGSTSDFDGKQFERATVGVDKPKTTNDNIAKGVIARSQNSQEYADFRQTYLEQNGTLQGADRFWKDYSNKNPIFDPKKEGTFELNPSRKSWKEHFKASSTAPSGGGGLSPSEAAELKALRERLGK